MALDTVSLQPITSLTVTVTYLSCTRQTVAAAAMTYYYRYELLLSSYGDTCSSHQQDDHDKLLVAIVFLSCKATENIRSVRDVFNTVYSVVHEGASVEWLNEVGACSRPNTNLESE